MRGLNKEEKGALEYLSGSREKLRECERKVGGIQSDLLAWK